MAAFTPVSAGTIDSSLAVVTLDVTPASFAAVPISVNTVSLVAIATTSTLTAVTIA